MRQKLRLNGRENQRGGSDQHESGGPANPDCNADPDGQQAQSGESQPVAATVDKFDHSTQRKGEPFVRIA
jgi:hypothetical protein